MYIHNYNLCIMHTCILIQAYLIQVAIILMQSKPELILKEARISIKI